MSQNHVTLVLIHVLHVCTVPLQGLIQHHSNCLKHLGNNETAEISLFILLYEYHLAIKL